MNEGILIKMLSAEELIESREKPPPELPSFGVKDFEPDGSSEQAFQIQASISEIDKIISYERVKMLGSLSQAVWRPNLNLAEVVHQTGSHWEAMGHMLDQKLYIYPEEALYLMEIGALEIDYNGVLLSVQRAYFVLLNPKSDVSVEKYRVYSHLNAHGYKVIRHSPKNTVTKYEKQLEVHKLGIKLKNFSSMLEPVKRQPDSPEENSESRKKVKLDNEINFPVIYNEGDNAEDILKKMQIFQSHVDDFSGNLTFDYDIYAESSGKNVFKKSYLQLPNYRVVVHRSEDSMPDLKELSGLSKKYKDEVPVIHAIVFPDYIAYYEINSVILPNP